ncbi:hypothetical protein IUK39_07380 [Priestia aryabhattai]|uniref:CBO0543 family protein n=1 Tax=Priestia aryabhattai TaxID=412384 RepID=UPI001C0CE41A|nr:CBO0543 family protein [Priestia aryabhattai]MBU3569989.1 hypothetical protein [Priestia aryabhattai]
MKKEIIILIFSWIVVIGLYLWEIPAPLKGKAQIAFLFGQAIAWIYVFLSVYFKRVKFPFREFPYATNLSFSLHYLIYPAFVMFFEVTYPSPNSRTRVILHYALFIFITNLYAFFIGHYTELVKPLRNEFLNIPIFALLLFVAHQFNKWFQKGMKEANI